MLKAIWRDYVAPSIAARVAPRVLELIRPDITPKAIPIDSLQIFRGYEAEDLVIFDGFINPDRVAQKGFVVDFMGARTRVSSLYDQVQPFDGHVHGAPIPGDYHAEAVEWIGLLKTAMSGDTNSDPLLPVLIPTPIMPSCYRLSTPLSGSFLVFTSVSRWVCSGSTFVNLDRINPLLRFSRSR